MSTTSRRQSITRQSSREQAATRRRNSILDRGREIVAADVKALERKRRAEKAVKYPKSSVMMLKEIFDEYDRDGSGCLDRAELTSALKKKKERAQGELARAKTLAERQAHAGRVRGQDVKESGVFLIDFVDSLFDALDANADGSVDFAELLRIVYPLATPPEIRTMVSWATPVKTEAELQDEADAEAERERIAGLRAMFKAYDRDGDGKVSITEFRMAMLDHENWDEVDDLFEQYDRNGNGTVDFEEFCAIVSPEVE